MGFPAVYSEMPRLMLNLLFLLGHLRRLSSWLLRLVGAGVDDDLSFDYSDTSDAYFADHHQHQEQYQHHDHDLQELEEHSQAVRYDALPSDGDDGTPLLPEGCVVCLGNFHGAAWVRRPRGCRHAFHHACLDRWAAHGYRTCPLCRASLLPPAPVSLSPVLMPMPLPAS